MKSLKSNELESLAGDHDVTFASGDYVKFEIKNDATGDSEWMWLKVDRCDDPNRLVFGWLDSEPTHTAQDIGAEAFDPCWIDSMPASCSAPTCCLVRLALVS